MIDSSALEPIRRFEAGDRSALYDAIDAVCSEGKMATASFEPTASWRHALGDPDCPNHLLLVATAGGRPVGWCRLFPTPQAGGQTQVELGIGVLRDWRRKGVGRSLLHRALSWARAQHVSRVVLVTRADNEPAVRLFRHAGFQVASDGNGLLEMTASPLGQVQTR